MWTSADTSQQTPAMIDSYVCAEIPKPSDDPLGYAPVAAHMVHGPYGPYNPTCPCMKKGVCSKFYPKSYQPETCVDARGFATYRCSQSDLYIEKGGCHMDNQWVVPYNMFLLKNYQAHINVEWCNKTTFIKYLFKYVTKGADYSKVYQERVKNSQDAPYDPETNTINEVSQL